MVVIAHAIFAQAQVLHVPPQPFLAPVVEPLVVLGRLHEILHLHQLEFAHSEDEVARRDLVPESLPLLGDSKGNPHPRRVDDVLEVDEHALRGLRPEVDLRRGVLDRANMGFEHQVEHARLIQRTSALGASVALDVIRSPSFLACAQALAEGVDEVGEVAGRGPHLRRHDEGGFQADDIVPQLHHMAPPQIANRPLHRDPIRSVVVEARHSAVDLARREVEAAPLRERYDFFHQLVARNGQASSLLPTRRARCAGWPTSPHGGEAKCKLDTPHPASPLRGLADLPTRWGGEMQARYSPPGEPAARAGRPPHTVGRRNANSILPTRRARCAGWPTSPHGGEAKCKLDTPHPARPLRGLADLPTWWGGEMQTRYSPPGAAAPRPGRPPHTVGRRMQARYSPPGELAARAGRPPQTWGGKMQTRYSAPGEPASRAGRPPHTVGRRKSQSGSPLLKD